MPRDERQRQKSLMKKRSKQKVIAKASVAYKAATNISPKTLIRNAQKYPLYNCYISPNWKEAGEKMELVHVMVARKQPDGDLCFGFFLIDPACLGVKNSMSKTGISTNEFERELLPHLFQSQGHKVCKPELAHQVIYGAIEYAEKYGFTPHADFALDQNVLEPRGTYPETEQLTFGGKDGQPTYIAGPHDNVARIIRQLEKTAGPGNFHILAPFSDLDI